MLSGIVDKSEGQAAIQRDVDVLKKRINGKVMRFNKAKANSKVIHLGGDNPQYQYRLGIQWIKINTVNQNQSCWERLGDFSGREAGEEPAMCIHTTE